MKLVAQSLVPAKQPYQHIAYAAANQFSSEGIGAYLLLGIGSVVLREVDVPSLARERSNQ